MISSALTFYITTFMISITIVLFTIVRQRTDKPQNRIFLAMMLILALNTVTQGIFEIVQPDLQSSDGAFLTEQICDYFYFLLHTALCPAFFVYVEHVTKRFEKIRRDTWMALSLPFIITEIAAATNPLTGWVYYYDSDRSFVRNWAEWGIYAAAAFYFALAFFMLMRSWRAMTNKRKLALLYFFSVTIGGVVVQAIDMNIKSELFCESIGILGLMIAVENEDDRLDATTGFGNRFAFQSDLNTALSLNQPMHLICLRITNAETILRTTGAENSKMIVELIAPFLKTLVPRYLIYIVNPETIMLTIPRRDGLRAVEIAGEVASRFRKPWEWQDSELPLRAVVLCAELHTNVRTVSEALYMADSPAPDGMEGRVLVGKDLDYLMRRAEVEAAVTRGIEQGNYFVCYQPTYHADGTLHGAEALIRLHDPELGNLYPDEFIPAAEKLGVIGELDCVVLKEVCRLLASGLAERCGIDSVNVNLSVLHCMQPEFIKRINSIIEESGIEKHLINFEITESAAAEDYELLSAIISDLKREGYKFSMDDYGTGYANMRAIYSLDFDVVKIDKSLLWNAGKNELGRVLLENSVRMIRQMHRRILVEGVETRAQIELLRTLGVDYLQGYYFSKPVPERTFLTLVLGEDEGQAEDNPEELPAAE